MKMKSIIIFLASELKPWSWFNFTSIAERTCRDAKNLLWKIRSMTCRNVKNNWNWYFNLKLVFNSIDQIQFVILLKGNVDNAFFYLICTFFIECFSIICPPGLCRSRKKGRDRNKQSILMLALHNLDQTPCIYLSATIYNMWVYKEPR